MRLEWPVYVFTACVFLAFALGVQFLNLGTGAVVGLFLLLTVAYAWVAYVMVKQKAVLELHAYLPCTNCGALTPTQGKHCMACGHQQRKFEFTARRQHECRWTDSLVDKPQSWGQTGHVETDARKAQHAETFAEDIKRSEDRCHDEQGKIGEMENGENFDGALLCGDQHARYNRRQQIHERGKNEHGSGDEEHDSTEAQASVALTAPIVSRGVAVKFSGCFKRIADETDEFTTGNTHAEDADVRHEERQEDQSDANPWDDLGFGLLRHRGGRNKTGAVRHLRLFVHRRGLRLGHNSGRLICWNPLGSVPHPLAVFA